MFAGRFIVSLLCFILSATTFTSTRPVCAAGSDSPSAGGYGIAASSYLGTAEFDDSVVGAGILSDGTILLAVNASADLAVPLNVSRLTRDRQLKGALIHLSSNAGNVLALVHLAKEVRDMAIDARDNVYLAAGADGLLKVDPKTARIVWRKDLADCTRVDVSPDGHLAAIADGSIHIFDPDGAQTGQAKGKGYTNDVCIDGGSKTVIFCGFRNARAFDGSRTYPVQICYLIGLNYDGSGKWTDYDWSTDSDSDRFLNKPTNNMADTRADRCAIGGDGKLYATFQVAGGNHIFRYSPKDIMQKARIVGGDKYHQFYNSRAEHKNFFARYEPATGEYLAGQQFCGRLSNNRANAVVTKDGDITADEQGRVYLVGKSAYGIPINLFPDTSDYAGGGFILIMSPDFRKRLLCTRTCGGQGSPHAVATRSTDGGLHVVFGGGGMAEGMFVKNAIQAAPVDVGTEKDDPRDGFFVVLRARPE